MRRAGVVALVVLSAAACSTPPQEEYYTAESSTLYEVTAGRVVTTRPVDIQERNSGIGYTVGGLAGGFSGGLALGGQLGPAGSLLGGVVGAAIGFIVEEAINGGDGIEYLIALEDGRTVTVVQFQEEDEEVLAPGVDVYIQHGWNSTRVVARSGEVGPLPFGAWKNPDELPPGVELPQEGIEIKRKRTGTYSDLDRPNPAQKRRRVIGF
ncbi:MAG: hypothetical protein QNJ30_04230 [Kiloniellales bacterium]|nr:hypothetical protein [Kiloniellales bacterium]